MNVKIGVSARHIHLTKEDLDTLFGENYELNKFRHLTQNDDACEETLKIKTEKGEIDNVRVLYPSRSYTQIEISKTDSYALGINPPVRNSGDVMDSAPITLVGPKGELYKPYGCIIAARHLHLNPSEAEKLGLKENDIVKLKITGEKGGLLYNVHVKIKDIYQMEVHIDLDDANAQLIRNGDEGELIINE